MVYLPVVYENKRQVPVGFPFIPESNGRLRILHPDTTIFQQMCLTRKFPMRYKVYKYLQDFADCQIEAATDSLFSRPVMVAKLVHSDRPKLQSTRLLVDSSYRYWRLTLPAKGMVIAELMFCDSLGRQLEMLHFLSGGHELERPALVFDGDALTYSYIDRWVGVDFKQPVQPALIRCIGRNDDNGVWPGNVYELFYQGNEGWVSLGRRVATSDTLNYSRVPTNGLLLLKNYTRGKEERIFTCDEKGTIRFW